MDTKSFFLGVACGVFVVTAAVWLFDGIDGRDINADREQEGTLEVVADENPPATAVPIDQGAATAIAHDTSERRTNDSLDDISMSPWPANRREELAAEPKDDSWAYYMEQALLQFLSGHPSTSQFDISSIECRTTKCLIEVIGYDEKTVPVWYQVMYDLQQQPWSEFVEYGTSSGNIDDRLLIVGTLRRQRDDN